MHVEHSAERPVLSAPPAAPHCRRTIRPSPQPLRTTEPSSSVAFMPISARSPTVQPCKLAWCPMVAMRPMRVLAAWPPR